MEHVKAHPGESTGRAPVHGMAAAFPCRGIVSDLLKRHVDLLYKV